MSSNNLSLDEFKRALAFSQPYLQLSAVGGEFIAKGRYVLNDGPQPNGPIEEFEIKLVVNPDFPITEPILLEIADRIPREIDRHMYGNNRCCTCVWQEWLAISDDVSFASFVEGPLRNFFLSQLHFELHGEWPFGERSHGVEGFVESVSRILGFRASRPEVLSYINTLTSKELKRHWICVCGSNKKIRDCDIKHVQEMRHNIDLDNLVSLRNRIEQCMKYNRKRKK